MAVVCRHSRQLKSWPYQRPSSSMSPPSKLFGTLCMAVGVIGSASLCRPTLREPLVAALRQGTMALFILLHLGRALPLWLSFNVLPGSPVRLPAARPRVVASPVPLRYKHPDSHPGH